MLENDINITEQPAEKTSFFGGDKYLWGSYIMLLIVSVIELYSASSREVANSSMGVYGPLVRHGALLFVGFLIILGLQRTHYRTLLLYTPAFVFVSFLMMLYVMFFGDIINGARRSFHLLGITIQPAEFVKLSAAALIALVMSRCQIKEGGVTNLGVNICAGAVLVFGAMLLPQGLTNTLLLMAISFAMMIIGGIGFKQLMKVAAVYVVCLVLFLGVKTMMKSDDPAPVQTEMVQMEPDNADASAHVDRSGTWKGRLQSFFGDGQPKYMHEITGKNRQEMYSYLAQANGGVRGVGPGNSRETARLPLAFSDFIYAIIVEDWGLIGGLIVLVIYIFLLFRAAAIASKCSRAFPALLIIGMAVMVAIQALFHIAIVTGTFPVSGQPLPLISKGGTSILVTSIALGVMLSVSRFAVTSKGKKKDIRDEINALPDDMRAQNPTQLS